MPTLVLLHDMSDGQPLVVNFDHVQMYFKKDGTEGTHLVGPHGDELLAVVKETMYEIRQLVTIREAA